MASGDNGVAAIRVLALGSYPVEAAAMRYRVMQFVAPLRAFGIETTVDSFLTSATFRTLYNPRKLLRNVGGIVFSILRRLSRIPRLLRYDVIMVQREAMLVGPPIIEWLAARLLRKPFLLDLDDALYVPRESEVYGAFARFVRWLKKTNQLIGWADVVTCGNPYIAAHARRVGTPAVVIPTVVDTDRFRPAIRSIPSDPPRIGWIGTHSTLSFFLTITPALVALAKRHRFVMRIVGASGQTVRMPGVEVEMVTWSLEREVAELQSFDIGVYPIPEDDYTVGKSGFKAIQYMTVGLPFVASPVGVCATLGSPGKTHFLARTQEEWYEALERLLLDPRLREEMGKRGRQHAVKHYNVPLHAKQLASVLADLAELRNLEL